MSLHRAASSQEAWPLSVPDAIRRPAIRGFDPARAVPDDLLRHVLALATLAPSSFNLQPWRFLVVRDERNRRRLRACAFNHPRLTEAPVVVIVLGYHHPHRSHLDAIVASQQSLGAITPEEAAELRGRALGAMERRPDASHWATRWAMLAAGTLMLAAENVCEKRVSGLVCAV